MGYNRCGYSHRHPANMSKYYSPWKVRLSRVPDAHGFPHGTYEVYNANTDRVVGFGDQGTCKAFADDLNLAYTAHTNRGGKFNEG